MYKKIMFIMNFSFYEFKREHSGTALSYFWNILKPIFIIMIYWIVFGIILKIQSEEAPYLIYLTSALIPWFFVSNSLIGGSLSLINNVNLVKKVQFDLFCIPLISLIANALNFFIMMIIVFFLAFINGIFPNIYWLQFIYYFIGTFLLLNGLNYIFVTLSTLLLDVHQFISIFLQMLMYLSPILWSPNIILNSFSKNSSFFVFLLKINPFFYLLNGFRNTFLYKEINILNFQFNTLNYFIYFWLFVVIVNLIGYLLFKKYKKDFADLL